MKYVCNHCQHSAEIDSTHTDPIPCGICGQGVFIEEEKYRTEYCYTRKDVAMMNIDRDDYVERLREENKRLRNALMRIVSFSDVYRYNVAAYTLADIAVRTLNAEQGDK